MSMDAALKDLFSKVDWLTQNQINLYYKRWTKIDKENWTQESLLNARSILLSIHKTAHEDLKQSGVRESSKNESHFDAEFYKRWGAVINPGLSGFSALQIDKTPLMSRGVHFFLLKGRLWSIEKIKKLKIEDLDAVTSPNFLDINYIKENLSAGTKEIADCRMCVALIDLSKTASSIVKEIEELQNKLNIKLRKISKLPFTKPKDIDFFRLILHDLKYDTKKIKEEVERITGKRYSKGEIEQFRKSLERLLKFVDFNAR